jgi:hypothetical protein
MLQVEPGGVYWPEGAFGWQNFTLMLLAAPEHGVLTARLSNPSGGAVLHPASAAAEVVVQHPTVSFTTNLVRPHGKLLVRPAYATLVEIACMAVIRSCPVGVRHLFVSAEQPPLWLCWMCLASDRTNLHTASCFVPAGLLSGPEHQHCTQADVQIDRRLSLSHPICIQHLPSARQPPVPTALPPTRALVLCGRPGGSG